MFFAFTAWIASIAVLKFNNISVRSVFDLKDAELFIKADALVFILISFFFIVVLINSLFPSNPLGRTLDLVKTFMVHEKSRNVDVNQVIDHYNTLQNDSATSQEARNSQYTSLVDHYYELATMFYEWGWGQSFHFSSQFKFETFAESIRRHEYYLASKLQVKSNDAILDVGCGIGGPLRNITRFTNCDVTGITINSYQVKRGNALCQQQGIGGRCRLTQGDFMHLPFEDESFDAVYAIEATCHAPVRVDCFKEIYRVLKPGRIFACYEWCLTDKYDPSNERHVKLKKMIEEGDGLPDSCRDAEIDSALASAGFEIIETKDVALEEKNNNVINWYHPLTPSYSNPLSQRFQFTPIGKQLVNVMLRLLEFCHLAPKGTVKVQTMLAKGGDGLGQAGLLEIFTPMYLCVARKPLEEVGGKARKQKKAEEGEAIGTPSRRRSARLSINSGK